MKEVGKPSDYKDIEIRYKNTDARQFLKNTDCMYDVIFLDGFSPQKDPTLWTFDFIKLISEIMNEDSVLVSYSKSTPFRSALLSLGFYVGKTILHNFEIGTIASFNPSYIKHFLSESDFKILCSRSGICYRDPDYTLSRSQIINQRNILQMNSNRVSRTYLEKCL